MKARPLWDRVLRQFSLAALAAALGNAGAIGIARAEPDAVRTASTAFSENGKAAIDCVAYRVQQEGWLAVSACIAAGHGAGPAPGKTVAQAA